MPWDVGAAGLMCQRVHHVYIQLYVEMFTADICRGGRGALSSLCTTRLLGDGIAAPAAAGAAPLGYWFPHFVKTRGRRLAFVLLLPPPLSVVLLRP